MAVDLRLTDEQAQWLRSWLVSMLDDAHWGRGQTANDRDACEHAKTISDKIGVVVDARKWER